MRSYKTILMMTSIGLFLATTSQVYAQSTYRCEKNGKVVFSDSPCSKDSKQTEIKSPTPPAPNSTKTNSNPEKVNPNTEKNTPKNQNNKDDANKANKSAPATQKKKSVES